MQAYCNTIRHWLVILDGYECQVRPFVCIAALHVRTWPAGSALKASAHGTVVPAVCCQALQPQPFLKVPSTCDIGHCRGLALAVWHAMAPALHASAAESGLQMWIWMVITPIPRPFSFRCLVVTPDGCNKACLGLCRPLERLIDWHCIHCFEFRSHPRISAEVPLGIGDPICCSMLSHMLTYALRMQEANGDFFLVFSSASQAAQFCLQACLTSADHVLCSTLSGALSCGQRQASAHKL